MPKTKRTTIVTQKRRAAKRFRTSVPSQSFQTARTAVTLNQFQFPTTVFVYTLRDLCPDLLAPNRAVKLVNARIRFYPVPTPVNKPQLVSVQGASLDLATNSIIPVTPIVPLSTTNPRTLFIRTEKLNFLNTGDTEQQKKGLIAISVVWSIAETAEKLLIDIECHWKIAKDNVFPIPALVSVQNPNSMEVVQPPPQNSSYFPAFFSKN